MQKKLSDFKEFKAICDYFDKQVKKLRDLENKTKNGSKTQIQTDLCRYREKRLK
jgi:hypothetical protein